jgi:hypothetical protein
MDCEKFDQYVLDALYDELDELTRTALERHMAGCARCAGAYASLRATREAAVLPLEEPSADLEQRILDAAILAQRRTPLGKRVVRALAWAGSHAMRREFAMAAVAVLVLGSSLLLLRAKPGTVASSPVGVHEFGAPADDEAEGRARPPSVAAATAAAPTAALEAPAAAAPSPAAAEDGPADRRAAKAQATKDKDDAATGGAATDDARAALAAARDTKARGGCAAAVGKLDDVAARFPGTGAAADAMWEAAGCYRAMGAQDRARELYLSLRQTGAYGARAEQQLAELEPNVASQQQMNQVAGRPAAAAAQRSSAGAPGAGAGAIAGPAPAAAPAAPARAARAGDANDVDVDGARASEGRGGPTGRAKAAAPAKRASPPKAAGF